MHQIYVFILAFFIAVPFVFSSTAYAEQNMPLAVRFWGQALVSIETYWNLRIVIDPYALRIGFDDPGIEGDLVLVTHEHADHSHVKLVRGNPHIIRGLDAQGQVRKIDMILDRPANVPRPFVVEKNKLPKPSPHAVHFFSLASFHDDESGKKRGVNAMFVIEVNGVRILHAGDLGQAVLTEEQLRQIGKIDVLLIPVGGVYTIDGFQAAAVTEQIKPYIVVPIHYKLAKLTIGLNTADTFLEKLPKKYQRITPPGNTLAVSQRNSEVQQKPQVIVLKSRPWLMPQPLSELFERKEQAAARAKSLFADLSVNQLNHRPANGTHTPRWNAEHMMGRELGFFSQIYSNINPMIGHIDLNPQQMPPDYVPAHPDWTGAEEARQIERVTDFTRRFVSLLDGKGLDEKLEESRWTLRGLLMQMEKHYDEHRANVKKKFTLPDWPTQ